MPAGEVDMGNVPPEWSHGPDKPGARAPVVNGPASRPRAWGAPLRPQGSEDEAPQEQHRDERHGREAWPSWPHLLAATSVLRAVLRLPLLGSRHLVADDVMVVVVQVLAPVHQKTVQLGDLLDGRHR